MSKVAFTVHSLFQLDLLEPKSHSVDPVVELKPILYTKLITVRFNFIKAVCIKYKRI